MTSTANQYHSIQITPTRLQHVSLPATETWRAIQCALGADTFDVVGCDYDIDLYVDDEGAINGSPFNLPLTIIAHKLDRSAALFGDGLALSVDPNTGETRGLSPEQIRTITQAITEKPDPATVERITETLNHPAFAPIIALLRAH